MPLIGERYWTYYRNPKSGWMQIVHAIWGGDHIDYNRLDEGRIYPSEDLAKAAAAKAERKGEK